MSHAVLFAAREDWRQSGNVASAWAGKECTTNKPEKTLFPTMPKGQFLDFKLCVGGGEPAARNQELHEDHGICLAAVKQDWRAMQYVARGPSQGGHALFDVGQNELGMVWLVCLAPDWWLGALHKRSPTSVPSLAESSQGIARNLELVKTACVCWHVQRLSLCTGRTCRPARPGSSGDVKVILELSSKQPRAVLQ